MIPNVFISSTIADLDHFRGALRETIEEIGYRAVMSEFGEVGYLNPSTAAESCYRSLQQCQMVILVVGKRYGTTNAEGLSITHKEYQTAREHQIPTLTLVDFEVLAFRKVFDTDPGADIWSEFPHMDNPRGTFGLLAEIGDSPMYNAIIPFSTVADANRKLKVQIADYVGNILNETITPLSSQIRELLAEVKTMRKQLTDGGVSASTSEQARKNLTITRYLLNDRVADYRKFLEEAFGDLDTAIDAVAGCEDFRQVAQATRYASTEVVPKDQLQGWRLGQRGEVPQYVRVYRCNEGGYEVTADNRLRISSALYDKFDVAQRALQAKVRLGVVGADVAPIDAISDDGFQGLAPLAT